MDDAVDPRATASDGGLAERTAHLSVSRAHAETRLLAAELAHAEAAAGGAFDAEWSEETHGLPRVAWVRRIAVELSVNARRADALVDAMSKSVATLLANAGGGTVGARSGDGDGAGGGAGDRGVEAALDALAGGVHEHAQLQGRLHALVAELAAGDDGAGDGAGCLLYTSPSPRD